MFFFCRPLGLTGSTPLETIVLRTEKMGWEVEKLRFCHISSCSDVCASRNIAVCKWKCSNHPRESQNCASGFITVASLAASPRKWTKGLSGHVCKHVLRLNVRALLLCHAASEVPIHFCVKLQAFEDRTNERWWKSNVYMGVPMTWKMTSAYMQGMYCKWFRIISWIITPLRLLDWFFKILKLMDCGWIVQDKMDGWLLFMVL